MNTDKLVQIGDQYLELGRTKEALKSYKDAIISDPNCSAAYAGAANCLTALQKLKEARKLIERAISLDPDVPFSYIVLSRCIGKYDKAVDAAYQAVSLNPESAYSHYNYAFIQKAYGFAKLALPAIQEAIRLDPEDAEQFTLYSDVLRVTGNLPGAEEAAKTALRIDPENKAGYEALAAFNRVAGSTHSAHKLYRSSLSIDARDKTVLSDVISTLRTSWIPYRWWFTLSEKARGTMGASIGGTIFVIFQLLRVGTNALSNSNDHKYDYFIAIIISPFLLVALCVWGLIPFIDSYYASSSEHGKFYSKTHKVVAWTTCIIGFVSFLMFTLGYVLNGDFVSSDLTPLGFLGSIFYVIGTVILLRIDLSSKK
jgi:tetratricopeptide (TPR) repeat protein